MPIKTKDWKKYETVVVSRRNGLTYRKIGGFLGISQARVQQIYTTALREMLKKRGLPHLQPLTPKELLMIKREEPVPIKDRIVGNHVVKE